MSLTRDPLWNTVDALKQLSTSMHYRATVDPDESTKTILRTEADRMWAEAKAIEKKLRGETGSDESTKP